MALAVGCGGRESGVDGTASAPAGPAPGATGGDPERPATAPESGKWRRARDPLTPAAPPRGESDDAATALLANPYLQGYRPAVDGPVIARHDPSRAAGGVNLYVSGHAPEAYLVDMAGRPIHRWRYPLRAVWPDLYSGPGAAEIRKLEYWRRAALLPDGGLLAIYEGLGLVRLDRSSRLVWSYRGGAHHDLFVAADGAVWVLDRRVRRLPGIAGGEEVLEDLVTVLAPDGTVRRQISIVDAFARSPYAALLARLEPPDILHTNTLEELGPAAAMTGLPAWRQGHLLLSVLKLDVVAVLDPTSERIVWALGGLWRRQHQPTLLADGGLLVFDNVGPGAMSRVLELRPASQEIVWSWPQPPDPARLYSKTLGSCQRLPNGNTLITESENGRAVEVTRGGEVVWEMRSPHRAGAGRELVATLFEVVRLPASAAEPFAAPAAGDAR